jgi:hypothetical protein
VKIVHLLFPSTTFFKKKGCPEIVFWSSEGGIKFSETGSSTFSFLCLFTICLDVFLVTWDEIMTLLFVISFRYIWFGESYEVWTHFLI